ncbi:MAG: type IX secretion system sortase PorU [Lentimicrobium sp.]|nr:type IX secretion system sortase PorU [Lentimicrobium sp.]
MRYSIFALLFSFITSVTFAQIQQKVNLNWGAPAALAMGNDSAVKAPSFAGAQFNGLPVNILPSYFQRMALPAGVKTAEVRIDQIVYTPLTATDRLLLGTTPIPQEAVPAVQVMLERGKPQAVFTLTPFGTDPATGQLSKIASFTFYIDYTAQTANLKTEHTYASNSVLASGDWYKVYIRESGIYKVTYDDLRNLGINMTGLNPDMIRVFGNGGNVLSESAGADRIDDLAENAIKVVTANAGVFAPGDYFLFYGKGTIKWTLNPLIVRLDHTKHYYADDACYFITIGPEPGKRIQQAAPPAEAANYTSSSYSDRTVYEEDNLNLIKSGRKWYTSKFDYYTRTLNLPVYEFPDMDLSQPVQIRYGFAGRATSQLSYNLLINGETVTTNTMAGIPSGSNNYARELYTSASYTATSNTLNVQVKFNPPNNTALLWLDYIALNVRCNLRFKGGQMAFADPRSAGPGKITGFTMTNASDNTEIWDVTDFTNVSKVPVVKNGNEFTFKVATPALKEFVAFDGTSFMQVTPGEKVANQNLHATGNYDLIIIAPPVFADEAQRLAMLHNNKGDISATVISLPEIYNEFSSGIQDITAIRDFMKMLYDRGMEQGKPQYMLMFGNASYDVKDRITGNSNFVPTYQSDNSISLVNSFLSDDYFGLLDDGEGTNDVSGLVDVASGRFPVRTAEQAKTVVDKIEHYLNNPAATQGDWRNTLLIIADDENKNLHLDQAEGLINGSGRMFPVYNIEKIYFDAYKQISTPGGSRYPDVNREIVTRVEKGALITNYVGHGGEVGWADERVLEIQDIQNWTNYDRMGMFFTATCEFSRFDNPAHTSAGELVFLNPKGGAMSMITTTRLAFASYNAAINLSFIDTVLKSKEGVYPKLGDVLRYTKNDNQLSPNNRHITLFGDPSISLPYPKHQVATTSVNIMANGQPSDTLYANSKVTVQGEVRGANDQVIHDFNGTIYIKVYDKPSKVRTLGQDYESYAVDFMVQKSIIYQGKASVNNGLFTFTFPVPRDIDYSFGRGKISYYATNGTEDAHGYYSNIIIGGSVAPDDPDQEGPQISLFVNDTSFIDGDFTNENPKLIAHLFDKDGINTVGNGIGHDIVATIDGDSYSSVVLNDYYVANLDSYQGGVVNYQYFNLSDGEHTLTLKAWDVFNNSASASITFNVKRNIQLSVDEVKAAPNPSSGDVWFSFGHNQFDGVFTVDMEIYALSGMLVRTIGPLTVTSEGYMAGNIKWDGRTAGGEVARNGLYLCKLRVRDRNNNTTSNTVKVILAR